jgi:hypothetical protein
MLFEIVRRRQGEPGLQANVRSTTRRRANMRKHFTPPWRFAISNSICAVDVKDGFNGQAHISLTLPSAGFRGGDQAFDILPFSARQVARVKLMAHAATLSRPTETLKIPS